MHGPAWANLVAPYCHKFCTIVTRAGKYEHALTNTNIYAVPLFVIGYCGSNVLKRQNEQEVQSQLVGYRWSVTQTKTASLGKG